MIKVPKTVNDRVKKEVKRFQAILSSARKRELNEADTVKIVEGILSDVLGWNRWEEVTSEYKIRNQYCDLATKVGDTVHFLIEVKAIWLGLKETHLKQVVHYAADLGTEWVVLTNGHVWETYRVLFEKPIKHQKVFTLDLLQVKPSDPSVIEKLFPLCREGMTKSAIVSYHKERQAVNRFFVAAALQTDPALKAIRRELHRAHKGIWINIEDLKRVVRFDVLKREVVEGDEAKVAMRRIQQAQKSK